MKSKAMSYQDFNRGVGAKQVAHVRARQKRDELENQFYNLDRLLNILRPSNDPVPRAEERLKLWMQVSNTSR